MSFYRSRLIRIDLTVVLFSYLLIFNFVLFSCPEFVFIFLFFEIMKRAADGFKEPPRLAEKQPRIKSKSKKCTKTKGKKPERKETITTSEPLRDEPRGTRIQTNYMDKGFLVY